MLFLGAQLSYKTFSSSSENQEKIPGVETNPPPCPSPDAAIDISLTFVRIKLKGNCKYIVIPAIFQNCQVKSNYCSFVKWPMFPISLVLFMSYIFHVTCISYVILMYYVCNTLLRNHWQWHVNRRVQSSHQEIKLI